MIAGILIATVFLALECYAIAKAGRFSLLTKVLLGSVVLGLVCSAVWREWDFTAATSLLSFALALVAGGLFVKEAMRH